jgi:FAD:protein FMN transferase
MRSVNRFAVLAVTTAFQLTAWNPEPRSPEPGSSGTALSFVHQHRYAMGTMFDIAVYHRSRPDAERAVATALDEIARLDGVMSNFKADSDLSTLARDGRAGFVPVDASLYKVIETSIELSRRSHGAFDITVGPLVRVWKQAREENRIPSEREIAAARRCVGYERIELGSANRVRLLSNCVELDLGAIGKGYAVDRAIAVLASAGIQHAVVNAGTSSIAAIGRPPDLAAWPVTIGATATTGGARLLLRNESISTSQQHGEIIDPRVGTPATGTMTVSVVAPSAMVSDALDTTLVLLSIGEGRQLLAEYSNVSAFWTSAEGELNAEYHAKDSATAGSR